MLTLVHAPRSRSSRFLWLLEGECLSCEFPMRHFEATEQPIDTSPAAGKAFLDMLGVFAEFGTNLRRERQLEGIAAAKAKGVYKGRPSSIDAEAIKRLRDEGIGPTAIAKRLGIGRASVYRLTG